MTKFRIQPSYNGRWTFERCDGRTTTNGGGDLWRVIVEGDKAYAEDRLAVAEGRMTKQEAGKRYVARAKAKRRGASEVSVGP